MSAWATHDRYEMMLDFILVLTERALAFVGKGLVDLLELLEILEESGALHRSSCFCLLLHVSQG